MAPTIENVIQPLVTYLSNASNLCAEIKKTRHCGSVHTQLDLLESLLSDGPSFITERIAGLEGVDIDEISQTEFQAYTTQLTLICGRLASVAHPVQSSHASHSSTSRHHAHDHKHEHRSQYQSESSSDEKEHEHQHHHRNHSNTKPLIFSAFEPLHQHHKEIEDPHFHELREQWEGVRDGIEALLAKLKEVKGEDGVEATVVEEIDKVEIKEAGGGVVEDVTKDVAKVEIKETEKTVDMKEVDKVEFQEVAVIEEVIKKVEKVEIKEVEKTSEVKETIKHAGAKTDTNAVVVVEVEEESHHIPHGDDISPLDSVEESKEEE